jgi:uncharacterized phage-associated protein
MPILHFEFDEQKLVQAIAYFAAKGVSDLTKMKVCKLLFFADKRHLLEHGRPIIGDHYACMEYGPVPSISLNEMDFAVETDAEVKSKHQGLFNQILQVDRSGRYPRFELKNDGLLNMSVFSQSDIETLDQVLADYGHIPAGRLSELTHEEECWKAANARRPHGSSVAMAYEDFFDEEHRPVLDLALQQQVEADELDSLIYSFVA